MFAQSQQQTLQTSSSSMNVSAGSNSASTFLQDLFARFIAKKIGSDFQPGSMKALTKDFFDENGIGKSTLNLIAMTAITREGSHLFLFIHDFSSAKRAFSGVQCKCKLQQSFQIEDLQEHEGKLIVRSGFELLVIDFENQIKASLAGKHCEVHELEPEALIASKEEEMVDAQFSEVAPDYLYILTNNFTSMKASLQVVDIKSLDKFGVNILEASEQSIPLPKNTSQFVQNTQSEDVTLESFEIFLFSGKANKMHSLCPIIPKKRVFMNQDAFSALYSKISDFSSELKNREAQQKCEVFLRELAIAKATTGYEEKSCSLTFKNAVIPTIQGPHKIQTLEGEKCKFKNAKLTRVLQVPLSYDQKKKADLAFFRELSSAENYTADLLITSSRQGCPPKDPESSSSSSDADEQLLETGEVDHPLPYFNTKGKENHPFGLLSVNQFILKKDSTKEEVISTFAHAAPNWQELCLFQPGKSSFTRLYVAQTLEAFFYQMEGDALEDDEFQFKHAMAEIDHQIFLPSSVVCYHGSGLIELRWSTSKLGSIRYQTKALTTGDRFTSTPPTVEGRSIDELTASFEKQAKDLQNGSLQAIVENTRRGLERPKLIIKAGNVSETEKLEDLKTFFTKVLEHSRNSMEFDEEQEKLFEEKASQLKKMVRSCKESTEWYQESYQPQYENLLIEQNGLMKKVDKQRELIANKTTSINGKLELLRKFQTIQLAKQGSVDPRKEISLRKLQFLLVDLKKKINDCGEGGVYELENMHARMLEIENFESIESKMWGHHKTERRKQLLAGQWGLPKFSENEVLGDEDIEFVQEAKGELEKLKRNLKELE